MYRAVGENYQLFIRLIYNEIDRHAPFHYRSWQEVPGYVKMSILTTLHHYFDLQQYHNTEHWDGIKLGIQADCANRYKDWKTKLKRTLTKKEDMTTQQGPSRILLRAWTQKSGCRSRRVVCLNMWKAGGIFILREARDGFVAIYYTFWENITNELNKAKSTSGGDDTPVDEVEVLERLLGQRRGHIRGVGRTVKSITPDLPPHMYAPAANEVQQQLAEANARWAEQQRINKMMQQQINMLMSMQGGQGSSSSSFYHPGFVTNQEKDQDQEEEEDEDEDEDE
ncbi:hypothetical protein R6Q57_000695 [Mikania cordata]